LKAHFIMSNNIAFNKRAIVTGATGYIGSQLVKKLLSENWQVSIIARHTSNFEALADVKSNIRTYFYEDNYESVANAIKEASPSYIFHLASLYITEHTSDQIYSLISSNILFSSFIIDAAAANKVPFFINTGTSWQHYQNEGYNPVNFYAATKQAFQDIIEYYTSSAKIKCITLVIFDTYGPNDPRQKILNYILTQKDSKLELNLSPGEQLIDMVHIRDIVDAYGIAAHIIQDQDIAHKIYGLSSKQPITLKRLINTVIEITNKKILVNWGARPYRPREVMQPWTNYVMLPGWSPKIDLISGIKAVIK
jgi:nucleoside-diphosphate-sugar epimerase